MAFSIVQSVASAANAASSVTATISSTTAGNLLLIAVICGNGVVTLTPSVTGTAQTFTNLVHPVNAAQLQSWYVKNCASGTTAITVTRNTGSGQWALVVLEVSGADTTAPLDQTAINNLDANGATTGTTPTTTQATEFWWAVLTGIGATDGSVPSYASFSAGWTQDKNAASSAATPNSNVALYDATQIVSSTGTAVETATATSVLHFQGFVATFIPGAVAATKRFQHLSLLGVG